MLGRQIAGRIIATFAATFIMGTAQVANAGTDSRPPTVTAPADVTLEAPADTSPANTGTATAIDDQDPSPDITWNDVVTPGICTGRFTIARTWTATDNAGNRAMAVQTITSDDGTPPVLTVPADITIGSGDSTAPPNTGTATATDTSSPAVGISFSDNEVDNVITRTWTATDDCGNQASANQTISRFGTIVFQKEVPDGEGDPNNPDQTFTIDAFRNNAVVAGSSNFKDGTELNLFNALPQDYTVREINIPNGWILEDISCTSTNGNSVIEDFVSDETTLDVVLASADVVTCAFTNRFFTAPTETPTMTPTETPTMTPTETPTMTPTETPTTTPTETPTTTPTETPTMPPTEAPTATPTATLVPLGGVCADTSQCASGFCVQNVCTVPAPAPAASKRGLLIVVALLAGIGGLTILRRRGLSGLG